MGEIVIDYVLGDVNTRKGLKRMELVNKVESDHHPTVVTLKRGGRERKGSEQEVGSGRRG